MSTDREMICGVEMPEPDVPLVRGGRYTADQLRQTVAAAVALKELEIDALYKHGFQIQDEHKTEVARKDAEIAQLRQDWKNVSHENGLLRPKIDTLNLAHLKTMLELRAEVERLKAAVAGEREACADLCYQLVDNSRETRFATAIRARGNK